MSEYREDCCWNDPRDQCPLRWSTGTCDCACHATQQTRVTICGRSGRGPLGVEFRDALAELVHLVTQAYDTAAIESRRTGRPVDWLATLTGHPEGGPSSPSS